MTASRLVRLLCLCSVVGLGSGDAWAGVEGASGRLQGSSGIDGARGLQTGAGRKARLDRGGKVEGAPARPSLLLVDRRTLRAKAAEITRGGLSETRLEGAASSIPPSQIGALLFDVARELEAMDEDVDDVAIGYYMAALADPEGHRYGEARESLHRIFLDPELSHEEAVRLYDGGKAILGDLSNPRIGLTREGLASGRRDLRELKVAYHRERARRDRGAETTVEATDAPDGAATE